MIQEQPPSRLRWLCRRGMQELDVLLSRWLELRWSSAPEARRQAFAALLEHEDDVIWDWLSGRDGPEPELIDIVEEIRGLFFETDR